MKILAICQEDPKHILGGMGTHLRELYRAMAERTDVEIDLLTDGPGEEPEDFLGFTRHTSDKLVCWKPKGPSMQSMFLSDIQMARKLTQLLAEGRKWDVIHVHEWNAIQVARMARDALNIPLVGTMHLCITELMRQDPNVEYGESESYVMQQEGHLIVDSDELILCSHAYEKLIRELFLTKRPINVVENGIRTDEWYRNPELAAAARRELGYPERPVALFVGRIADMKGIRPLLEAVERWDSGHLVVLAGEINANTEKERAEWDVTKKILRLQEMIPHRFKWVGFKQGSELKALYSCADVGLMPSIHEPFGIVALEFMAAGVPLVSTEVDGLGEVVNNCTEEYALIIRPNCARDIHDALTYLRHHPSESSELGIMGVKRSRNFDWHRIADRTVEVYRKAIEGCRFN